VIIGGTLVAVALILLTAYIALPGLFGGRDSNDFTAVDATSKSRQQVCFDGNLFYDQFGNCYKVNPASIVLEQRPSFVVDPATVVTSGAATAASAGAPNPASSGAGTGQSNPAGGVTTTQANPSGGATTTQPNPSGGTTTTQPNPSGTTTQGNPSGGTATTTTSAVPKTQATAAPTVIAITSAEFVFKFAPTVPTGGCGDASRVNGQLSEQCQDYGRAYGGTSNFQCSLQSTGQMQCTQKDGNRDMAIEGSVTPASAQLSRSVPGSTRSSKAAMTGTTSMGSTPGTVCKLAGNFVETVSRSNGSTGQVSGTWTAARNSSGC